MNLESCLSCFGCLLTSFLYWVCRYTIIKEVGDGTFGTVWRAIHKESGEVVYHSASPFFSFVSFFFSSHTVWLPVPLPSHLIDTPVLIGCDQENEEKILFLGRVHKPPRSEGGCCFMTCLISIMCSVAFSWVTYFLLLVPAKDEPSKHREAQGSHKREWHVVLCFWVHGMVNS